MADVSTPSPSLVACEAEWSISKTLLGGTIAMREAGEKYLPKFASEEQAAYKARLAHSVLFPAYKRTVAVLASKPFSREISVEVKSSKIEEWLDDVNLQGQNIQAYASETFKLAIGYGLGGILVEYPVVPEAAAGKPISQADEKKMGVRPYFVTILPTDLIGYKAKCVNGVWVLLQLRFYEMVEEDDGRYNTSRVQQIRVIEPNLWETHRKNSDGVWVLHDSGTNTLGVVPFAPFYGERTGYMSGKPPLLELAHMNVAHWQSSSDQQNILHVARVPILAAIGVDDDYALTVGGQHATRLPMGADLKYVEHTGSAISAGSENIKELEEQMRQAGAELLVLRPGQVTATQIASENLAGSCVLSEIAESFEDTLDYAISFMALWARENETPKVTLFKEFGVSTMAEAHAKLVSDMNMAGKISDQTAFEEMVRRGVMSPDRTWDDEKERLAEQGPGLPTE